MAGKRRRDAHEIDKYVGRRVRMRRLMLGMSQGKLAEALGLTFQQVQKYEKGINRMGSSRLHQIATVLKVPVPFFFDGAPGGGGEPYSELVSDFLATSHGIALIRALSKIRNPAVRRDIVSLVRSIADDKR